MEANAVCALVLDYIRINQPEALTNTELAERITRAFIAGMKSERGYVTVEAKDPHPQATSAFNDLREAMEKTSESSVPKEHCQREAHCGYPFEATCGCKCVQCA